VEGTLEGALKQALELALEWALKQALKQALKVATGGGQCPAPRALLLLLLALIVPAVGGRDLARRPEHEDDDPHEKQNVMDLHGWLQVVGGGRGHLHGGMTQTPKRAHPKNDSTA
jgi:hypothetical protein